MQAPRVRAPVAAPETRKKKCTTQRLLARQTRAAGDHVGGGMTPPGLRGTPHQRHAHRLTERGRRYEDRGADSVLVGYTYTA